MVLDSTNARIGVIGLGYVGLPLAVPFSKKFDVVGFDINDERVAELKAWHDRTRELNAEELAAAERLTCTADPASLQDVNVYMVTTRTSIDEHNTPDRKSTRLNSSR